MSETTDTFTCASCGETFPKGWSDEEAAAEAQENFPGIDITDPDEAGVVCDACYEHLMGRARAEAPELIGPGWRGRDPEPIPDYPGFIASLLARGYTRNPHLDHCNETGEHDHLRAPDGHDGIVWADGHVSEYDLTQPARLIYPAAGSKAHVPPSLPEDCYRMPGGPVVHVKPGCRCKR